MKAFHLLLVVGGYVAALLWAYATVVSPAFAYGGYRLAWPDAGEMVWLITISLLPALLLPYGLSKPSAMILWWLYLSAYIPSVLVPALSLSMPIEKLLPLQIALLLSMGLLCLVSSARALAISRIAVSPTLFWSALLLVWLACLGFVCANGRANMLFVNLASLFAGATEYDIRSAYIAERGRALAYIVGQFCQALDPFLIAYGLVYRRRMLLTAGVMGQIAVFSLTGFKTVLFSTALLPLIWIFMRRRWHNFGLALTSGLIAIVLTCAVADRVTGNVFFSSLITRRTLAGPGLLTGFYFEHYSQVSHAGIGFRISGSGSPYGPPQEIGRVYFGSSNIDANANLWAEGFADFGMLGIAGFTLFVAFLIWIFDSIAAPRNLELSMLLAVMPAIALSNTAPTTVLLTHGALAAALLLYLSPKFEPNADMQPELEPEERRLTVHGRILPAVALRAQIP